MTDEEIDCMMKDAEANAEADKKRVEEADLRNEVDQATLWLKRQSWNWRQRLDAESTPQAALDDLKKAQDNLTNESKTWSVERKFKDLLLNSTNSAAVQQTKQEQKATATRKCRRYRRRREFTERYLKPVKPHSERNSGRET